MLEKSKAQLTLKALEDESRDLFFFSGEISRLNTSSFIPIVLNAKQKRNRDKASLVLTTYGGDAHEAYRLARLFQVLYGGPENYRLVVLGPCKSAGTLVAVGAGELAMGLFGELGPLDVQLAKRDEIAIRASGLDTLGALATLQAAAFNAFETYMVTIINRSKGTVSTKTACNIAATIVSGLFEPIASQIDPHQLSEVERMMAIAQKYGELLGTPNLKDRKNSKSLKRLIGDYPTHEFIIDNIEANKVFATVGLPSPAELVVYDLFPQEVDYVSEDEFTTRDIVDDLESIAIDESHAGAQEVSGEHSGLVSSQGASEGTPPQPREGGASDSVAGIGPNGSEQPPIDRE